MQRAKNLITWYAVLSYSFIALGLPLPGVLPSGDPSAELARRTAGKDRSVAFPCMDKPCGCIKATQCFQECCCHTPAEILSWARSHDVSPAILLALRQRVVRANEPSRTCCDTTGVTQTEDLAEVCFEYEHLSAADDPDSVTAVSAVEVEPSRQPGRTVVEPVSSHTVVLKALLACGGMVSEWLAVGVCLLPSDVVTVIYGHPPVEQVFCSDHSCSCQRAQPMTPPPRVA